MSDEPRIFPELNTYQDQVYTGFTDGKDDYDNTAYFIFDTDAVYRATEIAPATETIKPVTYRYDDHHLDMVAGPASPDVHPGELLTLTRTKSWQTDTGSEDLIFLVTYFARSKASSRHPWRGSRRLPRHPPLSPARHHQRRQLRPHRRHATHRRPRGPTPLPRPRQH